MRNIYLLILLLIASTFNTEAARTKSRNLTWIDPNTCLRSLLNVDSYEWKAETSPGKWISKGIVNHENDLFKDLSINFSNNFFVLKPGKTFFFTIDGTGQVYEMDSASKTIKRIDRTYFRGYNFGAVQFVRKGLIYSFGGSGFWTFSNAQTYFDFERAEWEIVRPKNAGPASILVDEGVNGYDEQFDVFYAAANKIDLQLEKIQHLQSKEFHRYSFKTNKWDLLGEINPEIYNLQNKEVFWNGRYFFHWALDRFYISDPRENKVYVYKNSEKYFTSNNSFYAKGDTIYSYWSENGNFEKYVVKDLLAKAQYIGPLYSKESDYYDYLLGFIGLISLFSVYVIYKRRNSSLIKVSFDAAERKLLTALIADGQETKLSALTINEVLDLGAKSFDNQRRIRVNVINQINQKLKQQFGLTDAIERESSEEDKRLNIYRLNPAVFDQVKAMLQD